MDRFYTNLSAEMQSKIGNCIILEDFNEHIESLIDEYKGAYGE